MSSESDTRRPFQYSLRTFLIVCSVVGVGSGLLGQLFFRNPELFFGIVACLSTVGPFLLAIITILWMGFRVRRRGLVAWGILLLLIPFFGIGAIAGIQYYVGPGGMTNLRMLTTQQLIAQELPKQVDAPWVWQELQTRLASKSLSQQEVDDAVKALISHMTTTYPQGWNRPLSWQQGFLQSATQAGMISQPVRLNLCDAFYGPKPVVKPLPRQRAGNGRFQIDVEYGNPWKDSIGSINVELLWQVNRVLLDGKPLAVQKSNRFNQQWSGSCGGAVTAGQHEVTVEIQCANVDASKLIGLDPASLPKERWPKALKQWTPSVSAPLTVYAVGAPIVALTTSPDRDPGPSGGIKIQRCVVQSDQDGKSKIIVVADSIEGLSIPLSYDVITMLNGQPAPLGHLWIVNIENGSARGFNLTEAKVGALDPSIRAADIILTPNPSYIEDRPDVAEIWGKKVILRRVPLERLDLDTKPGAAEPARQTEKPANR